LRRHLDAVLGVLLLLLLGLVAAMVSLQLAARV